VLVEVDGGDHHHDALFGQHPTVAQHPWLTSPTVPST